MKKSVAEARGDADARSTDSDGHKAMVTVNIHMRTDYLQQLHNSVSSTTILILSLPFSNVHKIPSFQKSPLQSTTTFYVHIIIICIQLEIIPRSMNSLVSV